MPSAEHAVQTVEITARFAKNRAPKAHSNVPITFQAKFERNDLQKYSSERQRSSILLCASY
jgi:hypothetical protein